MPDAVNVFRLGIGGMVSAADSSLLEDTFFVEGINTAIVNGRVGTRPPMRSVIAQVPDDEFAIGNIQGACFYNPSKGQSAQSFSSDFSSILAVVQGRKFLVKPLVDGSMTVENVTNGFVGKSDAHIAYVYQAEVYAIVQDGLGPTWIYQPDKDAFLSKGYNTSDKDASELANGATVGGYIHGRIFQVVSGRSCLVGDIIHKANQTSPENILQTTEQVYWATGAQFSPPSSMGNVLCGAPLPLKNTQHGHGELMLHCEDGIFSLDISQYPRTNWVNLPLVKHVTLDSAARGPYALALYDGDQLYRSRQGIHSLRSQAATSGAVGDPDQSISAAINNLLHQDPESLLKFSSVSKLAREDRFFTTFSPVLEGSYRWSEGMFSLNFSPLDGRGLATPAWEGLWVPPAEVGGIVQLINGVFNGREQCFALCHNFNTGTNNLVEINSTGTVDQLPDGSTRKIECRLTSRAVVSVQDPLASFGITSAVLFLRNIKGAVKIKVYWRPDTDEEWVVCGDKELGCDSDDPFRSPQPLSYGMPLSLNKDSAKKAQFRVEWSGYLEVEALRLKTTNDDSRDGADEDEPICRDEPTDFCDPSFFSYLNGPNGRDTSVKEIVVIDPNTRDVVNNFLPEAPRTTFWYERPDGISLYRRPDGSSVYIRPPGA